MVKLTKYLKPFTGLIIAAVILLFVQAMSDLALPDYMSNIVNKGIQQGGIVNAVPKAIRESQMNRLNIFMNENDKSEIMKNYTLIDKTNKDYEKYIKDYPVLEKENIYVLNDVDKTEIEKMDIPMGKALLAVSGVEKMKASAKDGVIDFNGMKIPELQIFMQC
jgi:ATP-binding cassette subfamily B protein